MIAGNAGSGGIVAGISSQPRGIAAFEHEDEQERDFSLFTRSTRSMLACFELVEKLRAGPSTRLMLAQGRPLIKATRHTVPFPSSVTRRAPS